MKRLNWTKDIAKKRFEQLRRIKREREEATRWVRFTRDREAFDEDLEHTLDVWELMQRNQDGCGW